MAVQNGMYIFEVVVENVQIMADSQCLIIRSEFADVFSLELKDPKQMHIQMPEPLPLPPEPVGKKGKKKKPPKPKKGKKGKEPPPPPEPVIQSGQSVLFTSNAEFLIQKMKKFYLEVSLWNKEDNLVFIGSNSIPWDPVFVTFLQKIANGLKNPEPTTLRDSYNIFEENTAKIIAKLALQVKLTFLGDKVCTAFRTLTEDPVVKKVLYTGMNNKYTSYMCTYKTTDEDFEENCNKIENKYIVDKAAPMGKINYADFKNAPGANLTFFNDGDYCCMGNADKPPESKYKSPETCPDINFIIDYVRKIIVSCNDNMRMLTPHPMIRPRVKATDIDRLCYCRETEWPPGTFSERFKEAAQSEPCPLCIEAGKKPEGRGETFDIANIRGPCGRPDCRIARDMRAYIENLVDEDNKQFDLNELIGPCGSKECTLAEKIQEFIRHEGVFSRPATIEGLSTQCACMQTMQKALEKRTSCESICSKDCENSDSEVSTCEGKLCPFSPKNKVYDVYYFTVELDNQSPSGSQSNKNDSPSGSQSGSPGTSIPKVKLCSSDCVYSKSVSEKVSCTKTTCSTVGSKKDDSEFLSSKCHSPVCPSFGEFPPSPADSNVVISFKDINSPCCVKTCDVADKVKEFISDAVMACKRKAAVAAVDMDDPCYCDCVCTFKLAKHTTYCAVCGGYECLGDDMVDQPSYIKPHPCPVYNKLYDRKTIRTPMIWPDNENEENKAKSEALSSKSSKTVPSKTKQLKEDETKDPKKDDANKEKKKVNKFTANVEARPIISHNCMKKPGPLTTKYPYPAVPRNMGWNWNADDIPGMKPRPNWKPGAANRILVRRYRTLREGLDVMAKKKRAMMQKKKKIESKPTLIVTKKDGEYTVQMEVFKKYSKERLLSQYPYDENKPPLFYTIGKTEAEKRKLKIQRERRERRETRRKSRLIQSTFRDKCQEICLKAYNQAIGVLPLPNPNDPDCPCTTASDPNIPPPVDSCSCSDEDQTISTSDTDNDEWTVEFTAPAAKYDGKARNPPILVDSESQYTYLDYKVKTVDKNGNQVPRFFKGMDGKEVCSDLGGFWGTDHVWQEINKDGYIGPDNRWVPMNFIGPDGMFYSAEEGFFTDHNGQLLKIGIDGYINKDSKWTYYATRQKPKTGKSNTVTSSTNTGNQKNKNAVPNVKGKTDTRGKETVPCKGKSEKKEHQSARTNKNDNTKQPQSAAAKTKNALVLSTSINFDRSRNSRLPYAERMKVDAKKIAKYREIMQGLQMYEDFYDLRPLMKTNRATQNNRLKRIIDSTACYYGHRKASPAMSIRESNRTRSTTTSPSCARSFEDRASFR